MIPRVLRTWTLRFLIAVTGLTLALLPQGLVAAPSVSSMQDESALKEEGSVIMHEASKSKFAVPEGWTKLPTSTVGRTAFLGLRETKSGIEVTVSWSPLINKIEETVEIETTQLGQIYGRDKVARKNPLTIKDKSVNVIEIAEGPSRNGKEAGVVYLTQGGPDDKNLWKIKIRATMPKGDQAAAVARVATLLESLTW